MADTWVAIHPARPRRATSFVARDFVDAQGIAATKLGRGAQVTIVCDGESVEQAIERLRKVNEHSTLPSQDQSTTGPSGSAQPRRVVSGRGRALPKPAEEGQGGLMGFGGDSNSGRQGKGNGP